ncbi:thioredoxin [Lactiplantibacillus plantarum]|uniref:thioredoxin n=1 Tax=Lactiplantibacillus plantarum TaxID=1590 RepID=UPI001C1F22F2|nr:thioredoxin [Lactiplantibacillus plantarum]MBU7468775.1 thioredoxin [Lactiplantibacillus plantarum]MDT7023264.1 thioredoxin [Lactiplantibacillus plantarum]
MTLIKKVSKALAVIVVVLAVSGFASHQYVNHVEKQRSVVTLAKHPEKVLFFYRDDCPDCQAIFHQIYWHNVISHNIILINMNQPQNRHYIQKYQLTAVPTLISGNQRYVGTKQSQIKRIVGD